MLQTIDYGRVSTPRSWFMVEKTMSWLLNAHLGGFSFAWLPPIGFRSKRGEVGNDKKTTVFMMPMMMMNLWRGAGPRVRG